MEQKYCYLLDFTTAKLHCLYLECGDKKPEDFENDEDLIRYWGFNPKHCAWMITNDELEINHIVVPV